jgi:hypothetical protein
MKSLRFIPENATAVEKAHIVVYTYAQSGYPVHGVMASPCPEARTRAPKVESHGYARFFSVAPSELVVIEPFKPVGKKPPCFAFALPPKARKRTWAAVLVAGSPLLLLMESSCPAFPLGGGVKSAPSMAEVAILRRATCVRMAPTCSASAANTGRNSDASTAQASFRVGGLPDEGSLPFPRMFSRHQWRRPRKLDR